jgi:hypothetical protein
MTARWFSILACLVGIISCGMSRADDFKAVRERITVSTDMTPTDIEVAGSTSQLPQFHKLIPELAVRFRLARAYVQLFSERDPGFELLSIGVDFETASPTSLFETAILGARFGAEIPGIPKLAPEEARRRNIILSIHSDRRAENARKLGETLVHCHGEAVENDMWVYERRTDCPSLGPQKFGRIALLGDALLSKVECDEALPPSWARCEMRFPFEGFSVGLNFNRDLLPRWREVVSFSENFLKSKQYQSIESR